ncbi:sacsin N-terminal ATP-binding-like domain-containing protein [Phaeodactylibacter xiamenensis]|uniref:sacsin N-terminal ATP-binding-like domain-containing protein n=1 Tax=Phaeodactylibacter xiamenensis TaxID=1524460 RepID=UPI003CCB76B6
MKVKNQRSYREYFRKEEVHSDDPKVNINFIGHTHINQEKSRIFGFFQTLYGGGDNEKDFLTSVMLNIAEDHQSFYELIQNADDAESSMVLLDLSEDHLIVLNLGKPFEYLARDEEGNDRKGKVASLLKLGQSQKDATKIGSFGVGFKIVHRLLGENDASNAIANDYKGPTIFSWFDEQQFDQFLKAEDAIEQCGESEDSSSVKYPWLFKILLTCVPVGPEEKLRGLGYEEFDALPMDEIDLFRKKVVSILEKYPELREKHNFNQGAITYVPLAKSKYDYVKKEVKSLKQAIGFSLNFLNNLEHVYFQDAVLEKKTISTERIVIKKDTEEFNKINPSFKRDIEIKFGYYDDYKKSGILVEHGDGTPSLYNFFAMEREKLKFRFIVHCNSFVMQVSRRELQGGTEINDRLFPVVAEKIKEFVLTKIEENPNLFRQLFAGILLSERPEDDLRGGAFFDHLADFIYSKIPVKGTNLLLDSKQVIVKETALDIQLEEFGFEGKRWFYWDDMTNDGELINRAVEKLGLLKWRLEDIVKNASNSDLNAYFAKSNLASIRKFFIELCKDGTVEESIKSKVINNLAFVPFGNERYTIADIQSSDNLLLNEGIVKNNRELFSELGFLVSDLDFEEEAALAILGVNKNSYGNILFQKIATKIEEGSLGEASRLSIFNLIASNIGPNQKFAEAQVELAKVSWFKNKNDDYVEVSNLVDPSVKCPDWVELFKPATDGFKVTDFMIQENQVFKCLIYPKWEVFVQEVTGSELVADFLNWILYFFEKQTQEYKKESLNGKAFIPTNDGWKSPEDAALCIRKFQEVPSYYEELAEAFSKVSNQVLPMKEVLPYLSKAPFVAGEAEPKIDEFKKEISPFVLSVEVAQLLIGIAPKDILRIFSISKEGDGVKFSAKHNAAKELLPSDSEIESLPDELLNQLPYTLSKLPRELSRFNDDVSKNDQQIIEDLTKELPSTLIVRSDSKLNEFFDLISEVLEKSIFCLPENLSSYDGNVHKDDEILKELSAKKEIVFVVQSDSQIFELDAVAVETLGAKVIPLPNELSGHNKLFPEDETLIKKIRDEADSITLLQTDSTAAELPEVLRSLVLSTHYIKLPQCLEEHNHLLKNDEQLQVEIVKKADLKNHLSTILQVSLEAKAYLALLERDDWEILINPDTDLKRDTAVHKFFNLTAKYAEKLEGKYHLVKRHVKVKKGQEFTLLPDRIPSDKLEYDGKGYELSVLLKELYELHGIVHKIKEALVALDVPKSIINNVLGISANAKETDAHGIISGMKRELEGKLLTNAEQLDLVIRYFEAQTKDDPYNHKRYSQESNPFIVHTLGGERALYNRGFYFSNPGSFVKPEYILDPEYYSGYSLEVDFRGTKIFKTPGYNSKFRNIELYGIDEVLANDQKKALLNHLTEQYHHLSGFREYLCSTEESNLNPLFKILDIDNPTQKVWPREFAVSDENMPAYLEEWLSSGNHSDTSKREALLKGLGLKMSESEVCLVRKKLIEGATPESKELSVLSLPELRKLMDFIVQKGLKFHGRADVLPKLDFVIKEKGGKLELYNELDTQKVTKHSEELSGHPEYEEWKKGTEWRVFIYSGGNAMPHLVKSKYTEDYVLREKEEGKFHVVGKNIYSLPLSEKQQEFKIEMPGLLNAAKVDSEEIGKYQSIVMDYQNKESYGSHSYSEKDLKQIENNIKQLGFDLPEEDRAGINYEAKLFVFEELQSKGYDLKDADLSKPGRINKVKMKGYDDYVQFIVRSGKNGVFFFNTTDWDELKEQDCRLYVYNGQRLKLIQSQEDLLNYYCKDDQYHVLRIRKTESPGKLTEVMNKLSISGDHLIFRSNNEGRTNFKTIFEVCDEDSDRDLQESHEPAFLKAFNN